MKQVSIRQALQQVVDNPVIQTDVLLDVPVHELVARTLFEIANSPSKDRLAQSRANNAREIIFSRLVGKRKTGTHPATRTRAQVHLSDLAGSLES